MLSVAVDVKAERGQKLVSRTVVQWEDEAVIAPIVATLSSKGGCKEVSQRLFE